jgi:hypothetical protein
MPSDYEKPAPSPGTGGKPTSTQPLDPLAGLTPETQAAIKEFSKILEGVKLEKLDEKQKWKVPDLNETAAPPKNPFQSTRP